MRKWNDDPYTKKAKREDLLARSFYKLEEIDRRENLLSGAKLVIDLGASPGSWTQYCLKRIAPQGRIIAVDLNPIKISDPRVSFVQTSIELVDFALHLKAEKADVLLSDMAPNTSGIHDADVARSCELADLALSTASETLKKGGSFIVKLFMGESFEDYDAQLKKLFGTVHKLRPESTRKHSREIYFIAKRYLARAS